MGVGHLKSQASSSADLAWTPGDGKYGTLKETRKKSEVPEALIHVGGMRDPHKAVLGLPTVQTMGIKTWEAWMQFKDSHPEAITIAEQYGTENCEENEEVVMGWKAKLRSLWGGVELKAAVELESNDYRTPVEANLLEAWVKASGDPEKWVTRWLKEGTPLGIEERIETCGIFPPNEEETIAESSNMDTDAVMALNLKNYLSFEEAREDAEIEIKRYEERRYLKRISKDKAKKEMKGGTVSRLGLIIKTKESGERKRRVVIDLRRSGGNGLSRLPEKLTLPRVVDAVRLMKDMRKLTTEEEEAQPTWSTEMAVIDVSDAFTVLPVKASEQKHCLSPSFSEKEMLCFQALLFGHKVAPLLYSRFAALIARMLAAGVSIARGGHQVYLDDSLWLFQGTLRERSEALAYVLNTMCALGIRVALGKGERASVLDRCQADADRCLHPGLVAAGEVHSRTTRHAGTMARKRVCQCERTEASGRQNGLAQRSTGEDEMDYKRLLCRVDPIHEGGSYESRRHQSEARFVCCEEAGDGQAVVDCLLGHSPSQAIEEDQPCTTQRSGHPPHHRCIPGGSWRHPYGQ